MTEVSRAAPQQHTPEMVERVARAICSTDNSLAPIGIASRWFGAEERTVQDRYRARARAAIAAMREPTETMMKAAGPDTIRVEGLGNVGRLGGFGSAWTRMIDAALSK